ncbi:MAG: NADH-quinone oxidoreductase subunit N [Nitriliruptoraceae bacterium]
MTSLPVTFLAQVAVPTIEWSSIAPELPPTAAALVLLLVAISRPRPQVVALPIAAVAVAAGVLMHGAGHTLPAVVTGLLGLSLPVLVARFPGRPSLVQAWGAGLSLVAALVLTGWQYATHLTVVPGQDLIAVHDAMAGSVASDGIALFTRLTVYLVALLVVPLGYGYLTDRRINRAEVESLILLAAVGMAALGTANDLITAFIALEVLSLALYVLAGLARRDRRSQEASLKYFVLGAISSAILLYGMALVYVATGTVQLSSIGATIGLVTTPPVVAGLGLALVTVGVAFKAALAPFHLWVADVYQGAPTSITAFMAAATKAAAFALALRLYLVAFPSLAGIWVPVLAVLAAVTMLYGAYLALVQHDVKRMLAYSSVTHAGYAAIGLVAHSDLGLSATLWYVLTYAVGTVGAFGCVIAVERRRQGEVTLLDLRGLGRSAPALAGMLGLCLLSLAGIPATAGFVGKLVVFRAGIDAGLTWLVVVGVVSSAVAAYFYLRIAATMFLEEPDTNRGLPVVTTGLSAAVAVSAALVLYLGVQPQALLEVARSAAVLVR